MSKIISIDRNIDSFVNPCAANDLVVMWDFRFGGLYDLSGNKQSLELHDVALNDGSDMFIAGLDSRG